MTYEVMAYEPGPSMAGRLTIRESIMPQASSSRSVSILLLLFCLVSPFACKAPESLVEETPPLLDEIRLELEKRMETDQALRLELPKLAEKHGHDSEEVQSLWKKQAAIDKENMARLEEIVAAHGWPGKSKVGEKGALAAFLILQHAEHEYQKKYLPMVREAVAQGELEASYVALLEDRVLMRDGKPQIYGSQLIQNRETGKLELYAIENEAEVDQRRAEVGLPPLAEYMKLFDLEYAPPAKEDSEPPSN